MVHITTQSALAFLLLSASPSAAQLYGSKDLYGQSYRQYRRDAPGWSNARAHHQLSKRAPGITTNIPSGWRYVGCRNDRNSPRALSTMISSSSTQTQEKCLASCISRGFKYCGLQYGKECWGGATVNLPSQASANCNMACTGNVNQQCGAGLVLNLFTNVPATTTPTPTYTLQGCYIDQASRTLTGKTSKDTIGMTIAKCQTFCAGTTFYGVENGNQCFCGSSLTVNNKRPDSECNVKCVGDTTKTCGGPWRMNLYKKNPTTSSSSSSARSTTSSSSSTSSRSTTSSASSTTSSSIPASTAWVNVGCYQDATTRVLAAGPFVDEDGMTPTKCQLFCSVGLFKYAGLTEANACYCGDTALTSSATTCTLPCSGDPSKTCGGNAASRGVSLWRAPNVPGSYTAFSVVDDYDAIGCFVDSSTRLLKSNFGNSSPFNSAGWTPKTCSANCYLLGFAYSGLENAKQCFCGSAIEMSATAGTQAPVADCKTPCTADSSQTCGGPSWKLWITYNEDLDDGACPVQQQN